jgi:hypothetical protein
MLYALVLPISALEMTVDEVMQIVNELVSMNHNGCEYLPLSIVQHFRLWLRGMSGLKPEVEEGLIMSLVVGPLGALRRSKWNFFELRVFVITTRPKHTTWRRAHG